MTIFSTTTQRTLLITFFLISFLACTNEEEERTDREVQALELPADGITIENAWARPGRVEGVSAIYLDILNGSSQADTLTALSSPAAGMVEVHESYEREEGMMGMRPAGDVIFPARDVVSLKPGGIHIMLMQLNRELTEGDEIDLNIRFANEGERRVTVPVRAMQ